MLLAGKWPRCCRVREQAMAERVRLALIRVRRCMGPQRPGPQQDAAAFEAEPLAPPPSKIFQPRTQRPAGSSCFASEPFRRSCLYFLETGRSEPPVLTTGTGSERCLWHAPIAAQRQIRRTFIAEPPGTPAKVHAPRRPPNRCRHRPMVELNGKSGGQAATARPTRRMSLTSAPVLGGMFLPIAR